MVTEHEINLLAAYMVDTHGEKAIGFADQAVDELEKIGEKLRAEAWRQLRVVVLDMVSGRRNREGGVLH
ncbi:hypothetical protein FHS78_002669 [Parvibaculum indicum]|uniref:hypothetical protein n=1 Tax=Parvibaculum indicum TaxID=562969 RepID=UPI0014238DEE|nr:hypothetical protein [Parvibaculum indicum]NIJ42375.1 hypothetical protein [Parvibaculum indicum]